MRDAREDGVRKVREPVVWKEAAEMEREALGAHIHQDIRVCGEPGGHDETREARARREDRAFRAPTIGALPQ